MDKRMQDWWLALRSCTSSLVTIRDQLERRPELFEDSEAMRWFLIPLEDAARRLRSIATASTRARVEARDATQRP